MTTDEDLFTLIIKDPTTADAGRYTCVVRECNDLTCKVNLEVERKYFLFLNHASLVSLSPVFMKIFSNSHLFRGFKFVFAYVKLSNEILHELIPKHLN